MMLGKVISNLLKANSNLLTLVGTNNIYPYVLNENTSLPAIVYTIDGVLPDYDKDGWVGDDVTFSVVTFSDNYSLLQNVVSQVRIALELKKGTVEGISIQRILLTGQLEGYNITEDVFLSKLTFSVKVIDY